jgi:cytochrome c556
MKKTIYIIACAVIIAGIISVIGNAQVKEQHGTPVPRTTENEASLPASLDNLFPPKAEQPIFLFRMHEMETPFTAILVDLLEKDFPNVTADYEKFKTQYVEVSKLIPEWEKHYPLTPVNELGEALKTGDQSKVMPAYERVGAVCSNCHYTYMPKVYQKYHWGSFHAIMSTDPLTKEQIDFNRLMQYLSANFSGIGVDVEQGQIENARQQFQGFRARFQTLKETCLNCHDSERYYYVDKSVDTMIDQLGVALNKPSVDPKLVGTLSQGIGTENCFKCHLVHVPTAVTQSQLASMKQ